MLLYFAINNVIRNSGRKSFGSEVKWTKQRRRRGRLKLSKGKVEVARANLSCCDVQIVDSGQR